MIRAYPLSPITLTAMTLAALATPLSRNQHSRPYERLRINLLGSGDSSSGTVGSVTVAIGISIFTKGGSPAGTATECRVGD